MGEFTTWSWEELMDHYEMFIDFPRFRITHSDEFRALQDELDSRRERGETS